MKAKKNYPLVSVIVNCFNGQRYLENCILSIKKQTYKNLEIIFWDNKSTDNSKYIFDLLKDKRFRYFSAKKFTNLYEARNLALKKTTGKFITFIDVDDEWYPNKIEKQLQIFKKNSQIDVVFSNLEKNKSLFIFKFKKKFFKYLPEYISVEDLLKFYSVSCSSLALRRSKFNIKKNIFNSKIYMLSDFDFIMRYSLNKNIYCINEPLVFYREHKDQLSRKNFIIQANQFIKWYNSVKKNKNFIKKVNFKYLESRFNYLKSMKSQNELNTFPNLYKNLRKVRNVNGKIKLVLFYLFPKFFIYHLLSLT